MLVSRKRSLVLTKEFFFFFKMMMAKAITQDGGRGKIGNEMAGME